MKLAYAIEMVLKVAMEQENKDKYLEVAIEKVKNLLYTIEN